MECVWIGKLQPSTATLRGTDDVRNQSQRVHINWIKDYLDDETGYEVETVDGAVCSSQCAYLRMVATIRCCVCLKYVYLNYY